MNLPSEEAFRCAETWNLAWVPAPPRGKAGEHLGRGSGSSIEFQDRRTYQAGDDVRHLDWRAFARTGDLTVKLYREELLPRLDLLLDTSSSMGVGGDKPQLTIDLALFLGLAARRQGFAVRVIELGDAPHAVDLDLLRRDGCEFTGRQPLAVSLAGAEGLMRSGTLRLLISDFLSPHDAAVVVRSLARRAGGVALFQVLSREDTSPEIGRAFRMEDAETAAVKEIVLEAGTVEAYLGRLHRLTDLLQTECRRAAARFLTLEAGPSLDELCRERLARAGMVAPS
jgi:uncharacterized protein (DUF58 family)